MIKFQSLNTKNLMKNANGIYLRTNVTLALAGDRKLTLDYQKQEGRC